MPLSATLRKDLKMSRSLPITLVSVDDVVMIDGRENKVMNVYRTDSRITLGTMYLSDDRMRFVHNLAFFYPDETIPAIYWANEPVCPDCDGYAHPERVVC